MPLTPQNEKPRTRVSASRGAGLNAHTQHTHVTNSPRHTFCLEGRWPQRPHATHTHVTNSPRHTFCLEGRWPQRPHATLTRHQLPAPHLFPGGRGPHGPFPAYTRTPPLCPNPSARRHQVPTHCLPPLASPCPARVFHTRCSRERCSRKSSSGISPPILTSAHFLQVVENEFLSLVCSISTILDVSKLISLHQFRNCFL